MKIRITIDVDDRTRDAIGAQRCAGKRANREDVKGWAFATLSTTLEVLVSELDEARRERGERQ